jgi:hypothetical protein
MEKLLIILTKSRKLGNFCVAAVDVNSGNFVRVCNEKDFHDGALREGQFLDAKGRHINCLDIVNTKISRPVPEVTQVENHLIAETRPFTYAGSMPIEEVIKICKNGRVWDAFGNNRSYLDETEYSNAGHSLELIKYHSAILECRRWENPNSGYISNKTKMNFSIGNERHTNYSVTDPFYEGKTGTIPDGYLVLSLPLKPFKENNLYYKFIAALYPDTKR